MGISETMSCSPSEVTNEQQRKLLKKVVEKSSVIDVARKLGIFCASLYQVCKKEKGKPTAIDPKLCDLVSEDEFLAILNDR